MVDDTHQGPTGPAGPAGPPGITGTTGAVGADGAVGAVGAIGRAGATGPSGAAGTAGTTGAAGATGAGGADGVAGVAGLAGTAGSPGATGAAGARGSQVIVTDKRAVIVACFLFIVIIVFMYRTEIQQRQIWNNAARLDEVTYNLQLQRYNGCLAGYKTVENLNTQQRRLAELDRKFPAATPEGRALQAERIKIHEASIIPLPAAGCGEKPARYQAVEE